MTVEPNPYNAPNEVNDSRLLATYNEQIKFLVSREIELFSDRLHICGNVRAIRIDANVPLQDLVTPPDRIWLRSRHFVWATWLNWILLGALAVAYFGFETRAMGLIGLSTIILIPALVYLIYNARQNEYAQYKNSSGVVVFDLCRRGPSAAEFEAFNNAIASAVSRLANHAMQRSGGGDVSASGESTPAAR
ncbi:hypothetical protein [Planctomycetes bacterium CA13]|uniref:hypothetical protein n=1 Tax=Novipirellula herctigrandis TaxID=2527986 RepID=UPI0011B6DFB7